MGDLTLIIVGVSIVVLAWAIVKLNEKIERQIRKFKKFEDALKKNAASSVRNATDYKIPTQTTSQR
jgi:uncharacterized protein YoxC